MSSNEIQYEKGTIKVVWVEDNIHQIHSKMFENELKAVEFAKSKKDYIIFSLLKQSNMEVFSWKILPRGNYRIYILLIKLYQKFKGNLLKLVKKII